MSETRETRQPGQGWGGRRKLAHLAFGARPDILFPAVLTERQGSKFQVPHLISSVRIFFLASTVSKQMSLQSRAEVCSGAGFQGCTPRCSTVPCGFGVARRPQNQTRQTRHCCTSLEHLNCNRVVRTSSVGRERTESLLRSDMLTPSLTSTHELCVIRSSLGVLCP